MAKTGTAKKAAESAQEERGGLDMAQDVQEAERAPESAQEGAEAVRDAYDELMESDPTETAGETEQELPEGNAPLEYAVAGCERLNLRERPSLDAPVLAELPQGVGVSCTGERRDAWWEVVTGRLAGWVMAKYLAPLAAAMEEDAAHD